MGPDLVPPSDRVHERIAKLDRLIEIYQAEVEGPQPDPFHEEGAHLTGLLREQAAEPRDPD